MEQRKYGLFTAIAMIIGIVIGSGIYFKSYNILYFTGGNILQGVMFRNWQAEPIKPAE